MTMRAAEFNQLIAKRDKTGLMAAEAYIIVHHPQWQFVRRLLDEDAIGKLMYVSGKFTYDNHANTGNIRTHSMEKNADVLADVQVQFPGFSIRPMSASECIPIRKCCFMESPE